MKYPKEQKLVTMPRDTKVKKIENGHLRVGTPKNSREVKLNFQDGPSC